METRLKVESARRRLSTSCEESWGKKSLCATGEYSERVQGCECDSAGLKGNRESAGYEPRYVKKKKLPLHRAVIARVKRDSDGRENGPGSLPPFRDNSVIGAVLRGVLRVPAGGGGVFPLS